MMKIRIFVTYTRMHNNFTNEQIKIDYYNIYNKIILKICTIFDSLIQILMIMLIFFFRVTPLFRPNIFENINMLIEIYENKTENGIKKFELNLES